MHDRGSPGRKMRINPTHGHEVLRQWRLPWTTQHRTSKLEHHYDAIVPSSSRLHLGGCPERPHKFADHLQTCCVPGLEMRTPSLRAILSLNRSYDPLNPTGKEGRDL